MGIRGGAPRTAQNFKKFLNKIAKNELFLHICLKIENAFVSVSRGLEEKKRILGNVSDNSGNF